MPIIVAWLIGESILGYRWAKNSAPPPPGAIALASGLFLGCAVIGQAQQARAVAIAFAYGVDLAVLLNVLPGGNKTQVTNWPPLCIPQGQLLPKTGTGVACGSSSGTGTWAATAGSAAAGAASTAAASAQAVANAQNHGGTSAAGPTPTP